MPREINKNREALQMLVSLHPKPEQLLRGMLEKVMQDFLPKSSDQALDFLMEWLDATAGLAAVYLATHAEDHPDTCHECIPSLSKAFTKMFETQTVVHFSGMVADENLPNPLQEADTNKKTRDEILAELGSSHD